jgi:hypothetical protein
VITQGYSRYRAIVQLGEAAAAAAITVSIAGVSYAAFNSDALAHRTEVVADSADCRAVDTAIVAYVDRHGAPPATIDQIKSYVRGDVSAYRIVNGHAAGPGCPA